MLTTLGTSEWSTRVGENPPCGRYGHTMNIVGSYLCVFGGQTQETYLNDLHVLNLNDRGSMGSAWRKDPYIVSKNDTSYIPSERSRHTMAAFSDRLYLYVSKPHH